MGVLLLGGDRWTRRSQIPSGLQPAVGSFGRSLPAWDGERGLAQVGSRWRGADRFFGVGKSAPGKSASIVAAPRSPIRRHLRSRTRSILVTSPIRLGQEQPHRRLRSSRSTVFERTTMRLHHLFSFPAPVARRSKCEWPVLRPSTLTVRPRGRALKLKMMQFQRH